MRRVLTGIILASFALASTLGALALRRHGTDGAPALPHFADAPEFEDLALEDLAEAAAGTDAELLYLARTQDWQRVETALATLREEDGWSALRRRVAARLAQARGEGGRARRHAEAAVRLDPRDERARLLAADLALDEGDGEAALAHLRAIEAAGLAVVAIRRGWANEQLGLLDEAARDFEAAEALAADDETDAHEALLGRARVARARGELADARELYSAAAALPPRDGRAELGLGLTLGDLDEAEAAAAALARARDLAPGRAGTHIALGDLAFRSGDHEEALARYREGERLAADATAAVKLGNQLARMSRLEEAELIYRDALTRDPDAVTRAAALNGLGAILMHTARAEIAMAAFERAAALDPTSAHPLMNLALLHERGGDPEGAQAAWARALARDPSSALARARVHGES